MKALFALLLVVTSLAASAQRRDDRLDGRIIFRDGRSTVRISINERSDMALRIRMLEEAVRDLQAQVYDLRDSEPRTRTVVVCTLRSSFGENYIGKASSQTEAEYNARKSCENKNHSMHCSNRASCERIEEVIGY